MIKEGQLVTGRKQLSKDTGIPETTIERILEALEKEGQIGQEKNTKYRVITILHWKDYQTSDSKRTANGQQTDTNKNVKKEEKDIVAVSDKPFSLKEEIQKLEDNPRREMNIIALYLEHRKPDLQNKAQYSQALKRHLRPAIQLKDFSDAQIMKALDYVKKEYPDVYTLETLLKILTK